MLSNIQNMVTTRSGKTYGASSGVVRTTKRAKVTKMPMYKAPMISRAALMRAVGETKHLVVSVQMPFSATAIGERPNCTSKAFYHVPLTDIPYGTDNRSRNGDFIYVEAVKFDMTIQRGEYFFNGRYSNAYRLLILSHEKTFGINGANRTASTWIRNGGWAVGDFYQQDQSFNNHDGILDSKKVNVFYDKTVTIDPNMFGEEVFPPPIEVTVPDGDLPYRRIAATVPIKRKLQFKAGTGQAVGKHNLFAILLPYNGNGASHMGNVTAVFDVIFKDT